MFTGTTIYIFDFMLPFCILHTACRFNLTIPISEVSGEVLSLVFSTFRASFMQDKKTVNLCYTVDMTVRSKVILARLGMVMYCYIS